MTRRSSALTIAAAALALGGFAGAQAPTVVAAQSNRSPAVVPQRQTNRRLHPAVRKRREPQRGGTFPPDVVARADAIVRERIAARRARKLARPGGWYDGREARHA